MDGRRYTLLFGMLIFSFWGHTQIITTIAGNGTTGYSGDGGPAIFAQLSHQPGGMVTDNSGNLYLADRHNNRVRKIDTAGIITTFAGSGATGFGGDGGPATAAQVGDPLGMGCDHAGNIYVLSEGRVRKINSAGIITTVAGNGSAMYSGDGSPATAAGMNSGYTLAVDSAGYLFIGCFTGTHRIRKVDLSGIITTIAGIGGTWGYSGDGGPAISATIITIISADEFGNIYTSANGSIRKIDTFGIINTIGGIGGTWGYSGDGGPATAATMRPNNPATHAYGNTYFCDDASTIRKIDAAGIITAITGSPGIHGHSGDGGPPSAALVTPVQVHIDRRTGDIYINEEKYVRKISSGNRAPVFTNGSAARDTICANEADSLNLLLKVNDRDVSQPLIWSIVSAPLHGTAMVADTFASIGTTTPQGLYYLPTTGYSGNDTFRVKVFDGFLYDTITLYITVNPLPAAISGAGVVCVSGSITLANTVSGGVWSSGATSIATVSSTTGGVTGLSAGIANITYILPTGCFVNKIITVNPLPSAPGFTGPSPVCVGSSTSVTSSPSGGIWASGSTGIATVGSASGAINGISAGVANITYTLPTGCMSSVPVTVLVTPAAITGTANVCVSSSTTLATTTGGGGWASSAGGVAAVCGSGATVTVTGMFASTAVISYTLANGCYATKAITVNPLPMSITGYGRMCAATTTTLFNSSPGGAWSSAATGIATVSGSGATTTVMGVATGTATISYTLPTGCATTTVVTVDPSPAAITGSDIVCIGTTDTFSNTAGGGSWSSSDYGVAFVDVSTGVVTGLGAGTATISYTLSSTGCYRTKSVTVSPAPTAIGGTAAVCVGNSATLANGVGGGTWSSGATSIAAINPTSGFYTGVSAGVATMSYSIGAGCVVTRTITVNPLPGGITGAGAVCGSGGATTLTSSGTGTWASSNTAIAFIGSASGMVVGGTAGSVTITYTLSTGCRTTTPFTVNPLPLPITIGTGAGAVCVGGSVMLTTATSGGVWASSNTSIATVGTSGTVASVGAGFATISYTLATGCYSTKPITVNALPTAIIGASTVCIAATTTLTNGTPGGTWSKSNTNINIGTSTGVVTGVASSTSIITYTLPTGCYTTKIVTVGTSGGVITGAGAVCVSGSAMLTITSGGSGIWSSGNPTIAAIGTATGTVSSISAGVATISYIPVSGCITTKTITVNALPAAHNVTGGGSYCAGAAGLHVGLDGSAVGLVYQLYRGSGSAVLTMTSSGGALDFGLHTAAGTYTVTATNTITGCANNMSGSATISINALPAPISGATTVCAGSSTTLATGPAGGTWSSGSTGVATIGSASGVVNGLTIGSTVITYTLPTTCAVTTTVNVSTAPTAITGAATVCSGAMTTLTSTPIGGLWTSSNTARARVNSTSGEVTGVSAGTTTITYSLGTGCTVTKNMTVMPSPAPITGTMGMCAGTSTMLTTATSGGTWGSSATGIATVSSTGTVNGLTAGMAVISYTAGGCATTANVTVNPIPAAIGGPASVCVGGWAVATNTVAGGVWSTASPNITIGSSTGAVNGLSAGTANITYALGSCLATRAITINAAPTISGAGGLCVGATSALTVTPTSSGLWNSGSMTTAIVNSAGVVTGVSAGVAAITFTPSSGCVATKVITVNTAPGAITGTKSVCQNGNTTLGNTAGGGIWTSGSTLIATINSTSGEVTGWVPGTATITYSLGTGCAVTAVVTVNPLPSAITGTATMCIGSTTTLSSGTAGGVWSSGSTGIAAVGGSTGLTMTVSGLTIGTAAISYTNPTTGCATIKMVTVMSLPPAISGADGVCIGGSTVLTMTTSGGTWSSSNPIVASVSGSTGLTMTVTGVNTGSATITYSLAPGCTVTKVMTVNPVPSGIAGSTSICKGATTTLTTSAAGGIWVTSGGVATVGSSSGIVTGVSGGAATISYTLPTGCASTFTLSVVAVPALSGVRNLCAWGDTMTVSNVLATGAFSSTSATVMALGGGMGVVTANAPGTATITYTIAGLGCSTTSTITVNPLPGAIVGSVNICAGGSTALNVTSGSGGTWSSSAPTVATIGTSSGVVSAITGGTSTIVYTLPTGCKVDTVFTVSTFPVAGTITGAGTVCSGGSALLTMTGGAGSGMWSSSDAAIATVSGSTGLTMTVTGVLAGTATLTYTVTNVCGTAKTMKFITVNATPSAGVITGADSLCVGGIVALSNTVTGGVWSTANGNAGITSSGVVSGMVAGMDTVYYTVTENGCMARAMLPVKVLPITACGSLAISDITKAEIKVYPNPNGGEFVVVGSMADRSAEIEITNLLGQPIYRGRAEISNGKLHHRITLGGSLADGTYLLRVKTTGGVRAFTLVIAR